MKFKNMFRLNRQSKRYTFIHKTIESEEISVLGIIKYLLSFWKIVVIFSGIFGLLGLLFSNSPKFYSSFSKVIPYGDAPPAPSLPAGLEDFFQPAATGGNAGIETFPAMAGSRSFLFDLLEEPILSEAHGGYVELGKYVAGLNPPTKMGTAIGVIKNLPNKFWAIFERSEDEPDYGMVGSQQNIPVDTLFTISPEKFALSTTLSSQIKVVGGASISIETNLPEAKMSTRLNNLVLDKLVEATVRIKTAKQQRDLEFAILQKDTAKVQFENSQLALAKFRDENKGNNSAMVQASLERLSSDYSLYFGIYSQLATKVELLKIELLENTPIYEVFERAYVPSAPSGGFGPSKVLKFIIIGAVFGVLWAVAYTALVALRILRNKLANTTFDEVSN